MVEEATIDCYNEAEQLGGLYTMIEENLALPFGTQIPGVRVERIDLTDHGESVAVCRLKRERRLIPLIDLPLPTPPPGGAEWIAAYHHWIRPTAGR